MHFNQIITSRNLKGTIFFCFFALIVSPLSYLTAQESEKSKTHKHAKIGEKCFICDPTLRVKGRLWCDDDNRYEDRCWSCHPEQQDKNRPFCKDHNLYLDECFLCKPGINEKELTPEKEELVKTAKQTSKCSIHNIDKSICFLCDISLREKGRLWCKEHDRYEDRCWNCHPDAKDDKRPFCEKHNLYLEECIFCNLNLKKTNIIDSKSPKGATILLCKEHKVPEKECGICQPELASQLEPGQSMKIRFVSKLSAQIAGIKTALPKEISAAPTIEAFCQLNYNENKLTHVTSLVSGIVHQVIVDIGSQVEAGEVLVEINSSELAEAKVKFLSAIVDYQIKEIGFKREELLSNQKITSTRDFQEAEAAYKMAFLAKITARQKLLNLGFTDKLIAEIEKTQDSSSILSIKAPFKGTVLTRIAVEGEAIEYGKVLFTIADLSTMWAELSISEDKIGVIENDQAMEVKFSSIPGGSVKGNINWVATSIDERSRMIKARATLPNTNGKLIAGMFGDAFIEIGSYSKTFKIPNNSIQYFEKKPYLFVKVENDLFELRSVLLGNKLNSEIDIITGIQANDQIVVEGSFIVLSEFLKSRLGAGCVDD